MRNFNKINDWILEVINDGSWERFNDLHIDIIDTEFKNRNNWISGGISCYNSAFQTLNKLGVPYLVELCFHLKSKNKQGNYLIKDVKELKTSLDKFTPPSLYLFKKDWEGYHVENRILMENFIENNYGNLYYYQAYNKDDNEIRRSVTLV